MVQECHERGVVGDDALGVLADDRRLHAVVEQLGGGAAHRGEGVDVAAKHGLQILAAAEPTPEPAAVAEDQGEQPDVAHDTRLVGEGDAELGEVDLGLAPRRRLEAALEDRLSRRPHGAQEVGDDAVAARVAELADLAQQALARQPRPGGDALAQIGLVGLQLARPRWSRAVDGRFDAARQMPAHV